MNKKISFWFFGLLLLEYFYVFTFLLNYDLAWMNPEKFRVHQWILSNGPQWKTEDWARSLNIDRIENSHYRLSRPLSNLVEVIDTKWRASLWKITTPHPALSLQWPFMFILLPWLLYQTLLNMGCFRFVAFTGVCVYIASVGFLGPLVMLFHPAKNLANFFAVLAMFCFSLKERGVIAGYVSLFLGFMSDETGLYMYLVSLLLFHPLWRHLWQQGRYWLLSGLIWLPLLYAASIKFFLPYLHFWVRGVSIDFRNYDSYPLAKTLFWPDWNYFWQNTRFLFADHPHFLIDYQQLSGHPVILGVQIIYLAAALTLIFLFFKSPPQKPQEKDFLILFATGVLLMAGYCFFQTFQLSQNVRAWGVWYYGSLFSLIYVFSMCFFLQFVYSRHPWLQKFGAVFAFIFVLNGMVFGTFRIAAFKHQNLNPIRYTAMGIFKTTVEGLVGRSGFAGIDSVKGTILDPDNPNGVWENASAAEVRLKPGVDLEASTVRQITGSDFGTVWSLLQQGRDPYRLFTFQGALERSYCRRMFAHLYWRHWKNLPEDVGHSQQDRCYYGVLAGDFYFMFEESKYLPVDLYQ